MSRTPSYVTRRIAPKDLEELRSLYEAVYRNLRSTAAIITAGTVPPSQLRRWVSATDDAPGYVASPVSKQALIGHAYYERLRPQSRATAAFVVRAPWGGWELATTLLDRLVDHGKEAKLTLLVLATSEGDRPMTTWLMNLQAELVKTADGLVHWNILPIADRPRPPETHAGTTGATG